MEGSENSSDNPELSPQNSTPSTLRMSSQQRPLSPRRALGLSQWRAHLASEKKGNFPARINEPTKVKLDPDGPEAQETWERLKARGKSLLSFLQTTPVTRSNGLRYGCFSQANQGFQNIKPFDVLLSHAFRTQEASTSTQFTSGAQQSAFEKSISTPAVYSSGSRTHHVVAATAGMVPKTRKSPWTPPTSSTFQPASPSTAIMTLANGNSTLRRLLGHEIQPLSEEELKDRQTKLEILLENKEQKSVETEDEQQPDIDPRLTCILRANLSEPLNRQTAYPMPSCGLTRKRPAPVNLMANPTTTCGIIKAKQRRTLFDPSIELAQASSHAHAHSGPDSEHPRMPFNNAFSAPSSVRHTPPNLSPSSTTLKGIKFGIVAPNSPRMTLPPAAAGSSAQSFEHVQENGASEQRDAVVPSSSNEAKSQRDGIASTEQDSRLNDAHFMLVTIPTTNPAQQSKKSAGRQHGNSNQFQALMAEGSRIEPTRGPEDTPGDALTTPLVNLENISPHTISRLREAGVSAMALLMSNGAIVGIPIVSLDELHRSLPTWERLFLSPEEDGGEVGTRSAGRSTADDDPDIDVG